MRRLGLANAADIDGYDQIAGLRQLLERAELQAVHFVPSFIDEQQRRAVRVALFRNKYPGGDVDAGLGEELHLFDAIPAARGGFYKSRIERCFGLAISNE